MSSINENKNKLSEPFLNFLEGNYSNEVQNTYCEGKTNIYHDSNYVWCKICDKIFCIKCSLHHLINNQINHNPNDKIFLRKEHFDTEFVRDCKKMIYLKIKIDEYFSEKKKNFQIDYNSLFQIITKFMEFSSELVNFIDEIFKKIMKSMDNIEPKNIYSINIRLREDKVRQYFTKISKNLKMIENNYHFSKEFLPVQLKSYHDNLFSVYDDIRKLNELIEKSKSMKFSSSKIEDEYNKIKNILNNAISVVEDCKDEFETLIKNIDL